MFVPDYALIRRLELTTKKMISGPLFGANQSKLKGSGFEFHQLRDYVQGDDIRSIDWKSSARSGKMYVRQNVEDRNRNVYIALDVSASSFYGTQTDAKIDLMRHLAAVLAFVSLHHNDSVGLVLFTDRIESIIPPRNARNHIFSLVHTLLQYKPVSKQTQLAVPLSYLAHLKGQRSLICFISDFMDILDQSLLSLVAHRHDMLLFRCYDEREVDFPPVGTLRIEESETGSITEIEGTDALQTMLHYWHGHQKSQFKSAHADSLDLIAGKSFSGDLVRFLRTRLYG